jgi:hypothetical protein
MGADNLFAALASTEINNMPLLVFQRNDGGHFGFSLT